MLKPLICTYILPYNYYFHLLLNFSLYKNQKSHMKLECG